MPPKYHQSKAFAKLKLEWDKKLASSGFDDIEQPDGNLKTWHSHYFVTRRNDVKQKALEDYYRLASELLHEHTFETERDRFIWEMHCNGVSIRDTVIQLKKVNVKAYKRQVHELIQELSKKVLRKNNDRK